MSVTTVKKERLYHLDLIRFLAALYVVLYHYCFRGYAKDNYSILEFSPLEGFSKYGYLGVELFFMISGFVILMSAQNSNLIKFCISRFTRLYPAFWFCVLLTATIISLYGGPLFNVTLDQVLINLTMFNGFIGIEHVDGVYWSLVIELKFYILISLLLLFRIIKYIKVFSWLLLLIAITQIILPFSEAPTFMKVIYFMCFASKSPYFVAGMFFFLIKSEKNIIKNSLPIIISYILAIYFAFEDTAKRNLKYDNAYDFTIVCILITLFFVILFLLSTNKLSMFNKKVFLYLGILTYPLYLIHQKIGYIIFNNFGGYVNKWMLLFIVITGMLLVSYLINKFIEKPLGTYMSQKLKKNKFLNKLNTKSI
ncbi:acyltransferase family protein [Winogradskyella psychrotolerans]|uniref:acyltransferase family protein n=1 Tax=Winogradskyella psychrotolerans TaxID=1344585 RepID=UPI001C06550F|nr:acyltransferase [Winogradskyella psychrotolerans]MBU2928371.1 acyltransferase [Winogradskyella psychrotolerans]